MAYPTLNTNEIYSALYNMIIGQQVFDRIGDSDELVDKAKVEGTLYGDTKLFYAADVLSSHAWGNDAEAANLLALDRPSSPPECQAIVLDQFRQIRLTLDDVLSKRAWSDEYAFGQFNSLMEGMIGKTKRIYDVTLYNRFIGTEEVAAQVVNVTVPAGSTNEEEAKLIAQKIADLKVELKTVNRKYNEYGHITKFGEDEIKVIWNSKFVNKITKVDLPAIFHKDGLVDFKDVMPDIYFGTVITATNIASFSDSTPAAGKPIDSDTGAYTPGAGNANGTLRAAVEKTVTIGGTAYHYFPGEEIKSGATVKTAGGDFGMGEVYIEQADIIAKVYVKLPPYMSGFSVGTSFFNPRSHTTNRYLTFGHNTLAHFKAYPCITLKKN